MRNNPQPNIYGVAMKWIMTVKDHFSGFVRLKPLPAKSAEYVAFELADMFLHEGFPHIFHTDNGKEFTAETVLAMLKSIDPCIKTVTGRPRKPSDQGSVESANKQIQRILTKLENQDKLAGIQFIWSHNLARVAATMNSMKQKSSNGTFFLVCPLVIRMYATKKNLASV